MISRSQVVIIVAAAGFSVLEKLIGALVNVVEPQALLLSLMLLEKPLQVVSRRSNS
jgi:hypothetical protein